MRKSAYALLLLLACLPAQAELTAEQKAVQAVIRDEVQKQASDKAAMNGRLEDAAKYRAPGVVKGGFPTSWLATFWPCKLDPDNPEPPGANLLLLGRLANPQTQKEIEGQGRIKDFEDRTPAMFLFQLGRYLRSLMGDPAGPNYYLASAAEPDQTAELAEALIADYGGDGAVWRRNMKPVINGLRSLVTKTLEMFEKHIALYTKPKGATPSAADKVICAGMAELDAKLKTLKTPKEKVEWLKGFLRELDGKAKATS